MKPMYVLFEMEAKLIGLHGEFKAVSRGFDMEVKEEMEALINLIQKALKASTNEACYFTFGNSKSIDLGSGVQYGRLNVYRWMETEVVYWARDNSVVEFHKVCAGSPDKRKLRKVVMEMAKRHAHQMEMEAAREYT